MCVSLERKHQPFLFIYLSVEMKVDLRCSSAPTGSRVTPPSMQQRPSGPHKGRRAALFCPRCAVISASEDLLLFHNSASVVRISSSSSSSPTGTCGRVEWLWQRWCSVDAPSSSSHMGRKKERERDSMRHFTHFGSGL